MADSKADQLTRLADLRDRGVLSEDEFQAQKVEVLAGRPASQSVPASTNRSGWVVGGIVAALALVVYSTSSVETEDTPAILQVNAVDVTAAELYRAYDANEAAAQNRYGDTPLRVTGVVSDITLDLTDDPVIGLETGERYKNVRATLTDATKYMAASYSKGNNIVLRCQSVSEVIGIPMLRECEIMSPPE
jgi:hypothetical protein